MYLAAILVSVFMFADKKGWRLMYRNHKYLFISSYLLYIILLNCKNGFGNISECKIHNSQDLD